MSNFFSINRSQIFKFNWDPLFHLATLLTTLLGEDIAGAGSWSIGTNQMKHDKRKLETEVVTCATYGSRREHCSFGKLQENSVWLGHRIPTVQWQRKKFVRVARNHVGDGLADRLTRIHAFQNWLAPQQWLINPQFIASLLNVSKILFIYISAFSSSLLAPSSFSAF